MRGWRRDGIGVVGEDHAGGGLDQLQLRERLAGRTGGVSDGRPEILAPLLRAFEPVVELPAAEHVVVDTTRPVAQSVEAVRGRIA